MVEPAEVPVSAGIDDPGALSFEASFDASFDPLFAAAYRAAFRLLGDREEASECAQEALARAYLRWRKLTRAGDPTPWVVRVAANLATDRWRRHRTARDAPAPTTPAPVDPTAAVVDRAVLHDALTTLPRRQREVVLLRYVADLSEADTAAALGISTGTVKQHAARGLASLRAHLEEN